jgi:hypothetical protein
MTSMREIRHGLSLRSRSALPLCAPRDLKVLTKAASLRERATTRDPSHIPHPCHQRDWSIPTDLDDRLTHGPGVWRSWNIGMHLVLRALINIHSARDRKAMVVLPTARGARLVPGEQSGSCLVAWAGSWVQSVRFNTQIQRRFCDRRRHLRKIIEPSILVVFQQRQVEALESRRADGTMPCILFLSRLFFLFFPVFTLHSNRTAASRALIRNPGFDPT